MGNKAGTNHRRRILKAINAEHKEFAVPPKYAFLKRQEQFYFPFQNENGEEV